MYALIFLPPVCLTTKYHAAAPIPLLRATESSCGLLEQCALSPNPCKYPTGGCQTHSVEETSNDANNMLLKKKKEIRGMHDVRNCHYATVLR